jgi:hypothetical protein
MNFHISEYLKWSYREGRDGLRSKDNQIVINGSVEKGTIWQKKMMEHFQNDFPYSKYTEKRFQL